MGKFRNFDVIGGIYKFCGNRGEYAICIIALGEWTPLNANDLYCHKTS